MLNSLLLNEGYYSPFDVTTLSNIRRSTIFYKVHQLTKHIIPRIFCTGKEKVKRFAQQKKKVKSLLKIL